MSLSVSPEAVAARVVEDRLRLLLSRADRRYSKENPAFWFTLGAGVLAVIVQPSLIPDWLLGANFYVVAALVILAAMGPALAVGQAWKAWRRWRLRVLAKKFRASFAVASGDYKRAIGLLQQAQTKNGVHKALLQELEPEVGFKTSPNAEFVGANSSLAQMELFASMHPDASIEEIKAMSRTVQVTHTSKTGQTMALSAKGGVEIHALMTQLKDAAQADMASLNEALAKAQPGPGTAKSPDVLLGSPVKKRKPMAPAVVPKHPFADAAIPIEPDEAPGGKS